MRQPLRTSLLLATMSIAALAGAATDLYVACHDSRNVIRYDGITGAYKSTLVSQASGILIRTHDIIFGGPSRNFYIADGGRGGVVEINARTGAMVRLFSNGAIGEAWGVDFAPNGNILTYGSHGNTVHEFDVNTGAYVGNFIAPGSGGLNQTRGMVFGPANDCYVSGGNPTQILKYNATTRAFISPFATGISFGDLNDMVYGPDGNMFVLDRGFSTRNIHKLNATTGASMGVFVANGVGGLSEPSDQIFGPNGNMFISDGGTSRILQYSGVNGTFINIFATGGGMNAPASLVFADVGDAVFPDAFNVTSGEHFDGDTASLRNSDNNRLSLFNSPSTLLARVEISGTTTAPNPTHYGFGWETSVARIGLVETLEIRNFGANTWTFMSGSVASTTDMRRDLSITTNVGNYVSAAGVVRCRLRWEPVNDEDPTQDGWLHMVDHVEWTVH